jgi:hypothetical protein
MKIINVPMANPPLFDGCAKKRRANILKVSQFSPAARMAKMGEMTICYILAVVCSTLAIFVASYSVNRSFDMLRTVS